jgi:hypothetical protein
LAVAVRKLPKSETGLELVRSKKPGLSLLLPVIPVEISKELYLAEARTRVRGSRTRLELWKLEKPRKVMRSVSV